MKKWYFTFGSDPKFPYPNSYVVVVAETEKKAVEKFKSRFPDRTPNTVNCAFWYSESEWQECNEILRQTSPAETVE